MTAFPVQRRVFLTGLGAWASSASAAERGTVASFSVLANIVRRVSGDRLPVISLVPVNMDAHGWQPTAADLRAVASAAVLVENGLGLEGWISRLATASGFKGRLVVASTGVTPRFIREGKVTSLDPHAWQDPRNGMIYARNIADGLAAADPDHASEYRANAATYAAELEALDIWISERFASIPVKARRIITTHDAFGYYGDRYGITFLAAEGLAADAEPSAKSIAVLVRQIRREKARTVFLENMTDPRLARMLARESGATLSGPLYSDALSEPGGPAPDYLSMLRYNTSLFERAMRPE